MCKLCTTHDMMQVEKGILYISRHSFTAHKKKQDLILHRGYGGNCLHIHSILSVCFKRSTPVKIYIFLNEVPTTKDKQLPKQKRQTWKNLPVLNKNNIKYTEMCNTLNIPVFICPYFDLKFCTPISFDKGKNATCFSDLKTKEWVCKILWMGRLM